MPLRCQSPMPPHNGLRVLFVEPDDDLRYVMSTLLRLVGCNVRAAANGADALASIKAFAADVVLSELTLSDVNGFELARYIRALPNTEHVVLIALVSLCKENTRSDAVRAGFARLLVKPLPCERILDVLGPIAESRGRTLESSEC
ncbi:response regulator [Massilia sp. TW-1]|uniref:Response regulator n=2 Tax=Telluria antibiotica TaxID=2717319 RepID=A0ABX0PLB1_9BURK|nr:response regulator [Telluria antibiotica]